jgi:hypothetical protein
MRFRSPLSDGITLTFVACIIFGAVGLSSAILVNGAEHPDEQNKNYNVEPWPYEYKKYHNEHLNFSFEYPGQWEIKEDVKGGGVTIAPKLGPNLPRIGVRSAEVQLDQGGTPRTLEEDFETSLELLKGYRFDATHHIEKVRIVKREPTTFQGLPAIFRKVTYTVGGKNWVDEGFILRGEDNHYSFGVAVICRGEELPAFQAVFDTVIRSFRFSEPLK